MAKIVKKLTDLVGNTPLMELSGYCGKYGMEQNIIAKLEAFNPAGSVKDRVALETRCDDYRTHKWKYRCRAGNGVYYKRLSSHIDYARNDEPGTEESVEGTRCTNRIDGRTGRHGSVYR